MAALPHQRARSASPEDRLLNGLSCPLNHFTPRPKRMLGLLGVGKKKIKVRKPTELAHDVKESLVQLRSARHGDRAIKSIAIESASNHDIESEPSATTKTTTSTNSDGLGSCESPELVLKRESVVSKPHSRSEERARHQLATALLELKQCLYDDVDTDWLRSSGTSSSTLQSYGGVSPRSNSRASSKASSRRNSLEQEVRAHPGEDTSLAAPGGASRAQTDDEESVENQRIRLDIATKRAQLRDIAHDLDLLLLIASSLSYMEFESRKDAAAIFNNLLRRQAEEQELCVNPLILEALMREYSRPKVALNCGSMLRELFRHESCVRCLLKNSDYIWMFFQMVQLSNFDVASDAFTTFRVVLTRHKKVLAEFLLDNFERFFLLEYEALLKSSNYVTKRQGLKLLGELLLDRTNFYVMTRYVSHTSNLKLIMNLMLDPGKSIQFEAFHIFKLIAANPKKPDAIKKILFRNKDKLLRYLAAFGNEGRGGSVAIGDEAFREDLRLVGAEIEALTDKSISLTSTTEPPSSTYHGATAVDRTSSTSSNAIGGHS